MNNRSLLFLSLLFTVAIDAMETNDYSKYGSVDLCLTLARSDDVTSQSWKTIHALLDDYQHQKRLKKFSLDLLLSTINQSWEAADKSDQEISVTPVVSFYKACKNSPQSSPQKVYLPDHIILCGTEDATHFPTSILEHAGVYKLLQLSIKTWRTASTYNQKGWYTIVAEATRLQKKIAVDTATKKDCTDTITTWFTTSITSEKTIWGDASVFKTQDSQLIDS